MLSAERCLGGQAFQIVSVLPAERVVHRSKMISDLDIWHAANLLIRQHGADAELEAARLADLMLDRGDRDG